MSGTRGDGPGRAAEDPRGRNVLDTGGAGYVGPHLVAALVEHSDVQVLDDESSGDLSEIPADATPIEAGVRDAAGSDSEIVHVDPGPADVRRSYADVSKARSVLGYVPSISAREGLRGLADRG